MSGIIGPRDTLSQDEISVVIERGDGPTAMDQTQTDLVKTHCLKWSPDNVPPDHISLSPITKSPGDIQKKSMAPDIGTIGFCRIKPGDLQGPFESIIHGETDQSSSGMAGNSNLLGMLLSRFLTGSEDKRKVPPKIQEVIERGAKIRKIIETGKTHSLSLYKGLPTHGAIGPLMAKFNQVKNIPTAIQNYSSLLNQDMMNSLPGSIMSLGQLLKSFTPQQQQQIKASMPPQIAQAFDSIAGLAQDIEYTELGDSTTVGRVNPDVFTNNAITLYSQCTTIADLCDATTEIMSNTALHGLDQYANTVYTVDTAFGNTSLILFPNGDFIEEELANTTNNRSNFHTSMGSSSGAPAAGGTNMFGSSAGIMQQLLQRLSPAAQKKGTQQQKSLHSRSKTNKNTGPSTSNEKAEEGEPPLAVSPAAWSDSSNIF